MGVPIERRGWRTQPKPWVWITTSENVESSVLSGAFPDVSREKLVRSKIRFFTIGIADIAESRRWRIFGRHPLFLPPTQNTLASLRCLFGKLIHGEHLSRFFLPVSFDLGPNYERFQFSKRSNETDDSVRKMQAWATVFSEVLRKIMLFEIPGLIYIRLWSPNHRPTIQNWSLMRQ